MIFFSTSADFWAGLSAAWAFAAIDSHTPLKLVKNPVAWLKSASLQ